MPKMIILVVLEEAWIRLSIGRNPECQTQQREHEPFHSETGTMREQSMSPESTPPVAREDVCQSMGLV